MRKRIFTLILLSGLLLPVAGWGKMSQIDPDGAWIVAKAPEGPTVDLDGRSGTHSLTEGASVPPRAAVPVDDISGRSLFHQLLSWLQMQLQGI
jgi:hypothetical protein